ncbi:hypothetical protein M378DRAFT_93416, partial [Amanita muscaria Koide BX008]
FSPDGKRIASGSHDKTICIWDVETGEQVTNPLKGHTGYVRSVAFSPDGKRIASGSNDKTIYVWDAEINIPSPIAHGKHVALDPHGWITGPYPQGHLLMWIPEAKRKPFLTNRVTMIISKQAVELDLSSMAHGYMWDRCYDG